MSNNEWPEYLMIRDTKLNDDMGGLGQRIFTTAGAGYEKRKYVREDIFARLSEEAEALRRDKEIAESRLSFVLSKVGFDKDGPYILSTFSIARIVMGGDSIEAIDQLRAGKV